MVKQLVFLFFICFHYSCQQKTAPANIELHNYIQLEGEDNMRDLGGFVGQDGKSIKYRKLFRSGELSTLTRADQDSMIILGIEQIIDLRSKSELEEAPDNIPEGILHYHLPLIKLGSSADVMDQILKGEVDPKELMLDVYSNIDSLKIANWKTIFDHLEKGKVSLWHCTAGKDRAGMTTALVLASLGVEEKLIVNDFMESNTFLAPYRNKTFASFSSKFGHEAAELAKPLLRVEESYIQTFLQVIQKEYGGVNKFLETLDVDIQSMQDNYLE